MTQYEMTDPPGKQAFTPDDGKQHVANYLRWLSTLAKALIKSTDPLGMEPALCPESPDQTE